MQSEIALQDFGCCYFKLYYVPTGLLLAISPKTPLKLFSWMPVRRLLRPRAIYHSGHLFGTTTTATRRPICTVITLPRLHACANPRTCFALCALHTYRSLHRPTPRWVLRVWTWPSSSRINIRKVISQMRKTNRHGSMLLAPTTARFSSRGTRPTRTRPRNKREYLDALDATHEPSQPAPQRYCRRPTSSTTHATWPPQ